MIHSDQGTQFAAESYRQYLLSQNMQQSMSRRGNCYDNARMESFFGTLKEEMPLLFPYETAAQWEASIASYMDYYNHERIMLRLQAPPDPPRP